MNYQESNYKAGLCGKRHAYCKLCRPEVVEHIIAAPSIGKGVYIRSLEQKAILRRRWQQQAVIQAALRVGTSPSEETRAKISASNAGRILTEEQRENITRGLVRSVNRRNPTSLEYALQMLLESADLDYEAQVRFGRYLVDFWIPSHRLVFEADGMFWYHHQDKEREALRDAYLREREVLSVVHLDDKDLENWGIT